MLSFLPTWNWVSFCSCFIVKWCASDANSVHHCIEDGGRYEESWAMDWTISVCCFSVGNSNKNPATSLRRASELPGQTISKRCREHYLTSWVILLQCDLVKNKYHISGSVWVSEIGTCFIVASLILFFSFRSINLTPAKWSGYLRGYLVDGVNVETQLGFRWQFGWQMIENTLDEET